MASNVKISQLPVGGALSGTEMVPLVQAGLTKRVPSSAFNLSSGGGAVSAPAFILLPAGINAQAGTAYTLQAADNGTVITLTNGAPITLTCPTGLAVGFSCTIWQLGAGQVNVVAGGGATLSSYNGLTHLAGQFAAGTILQPAANSFVLAGQTA